MNRLSYCYCFHQLDCQCTIYYR